MQDDWARKERNGEAMWNNINRDEMKRHPHFFLFCLFTLSASWNRSYNTRYTCHSLYQSDGRWRTHIHTRRLMQTGRTKQVVCLLPFILCLAENCCAFRNMSRPWSICTATQRRTEPELEPRADVGRGICGDEGLQHRRACAPQITLQHLMEPGPSLLESTSCSDSNRSALQTPFVMIGFSYRAEMACWW